MKVKDILEMIKWEGFEEALFYGISECQELGKTFIGITLSNGEGIIIKVDPYVDEITDILLYTDKKYSNEELRPLGVFKQGETSNTYFIYQILNLRNFINRYDNDIKVVYVEVIKGDLEDFLYTAMA